MKNRIFWSILLTSVLLLISICLTLFFTMYNSFTKENMEEIKLEAEYLLTGYEQGGIEYIKAAAKKGVNRITVISSDGNVVYDSYADTEEMENHLHRTEISEAYSEGVGSDIRSSATSGEKTYYYALRASNGNVVRVAATMDALTKVLSNSVTMFLILLIVSIFAVIIVSTKITAAIIKPINQIDPKRPLETGIYDELSPLLQRMHSQNLKIKDQLKKLEQAKTEFEEITNRMSEALIVFSYEKKVISANKSARELFKGTELEGIACNELSQDEKYLKATEKAFNGSNSSFKLQADDRIFRINITPVKGDKATAAVLFAEDITDSELSEQMRREFSANVSHELKTPLTSIMGAAEIMQAGIAAPEDHPHFISQIHKESKRLLSLIEDIIGLSKLDEGAVGEKFVSCSLKKIAEQTITELTDKAKENGITLRVTEEDAFVQGIESSLHEMIYNLCDNAIKYNNPGGYVEIGVIPSSEPRIYVKDNGIGIAKEDHNRVFERFYRVDKSRSKQTGGTGLGLSIVKHAAILHNAELEIESELGEGTKISVIFKQKAS